jgi:hypothetical protein
LKFFTAIASKGSEDIEEIVTAFSTMSLLEPRVNRSLFCMYSSHLQTRVDLIAQGCDVGFGIGEFYISDNERYPLLSLTSSQTTSSPVRESEDSFFDGILHEHQYFRRYPQPSSKSINTSKATLDRLKPLSRSFASCVLHSKSEYGSNVLKFVHNNFQSSGMSDRCKSFLLQEEHKDKALSFFFSTHSKEPTNICVEVSNIDISVVAEGQLTMVNEVISSIIEVRRSWDSSQYNPVEESEIHKPSTSLRETPRSINKSENDDKFDTNKGLAGYDSHLKFRQQRNMDEGTNLLLVFRSININLGSEKKLLSQICLQSLNISIALLSSNDSESLSTGCELKSLNLYDLSLAGEMHQKLLWTMASDSPSIIVEVVKGDCQLLLNKIRIRLVKRFIDELMTLVDIKLVQPLLESLKALETISNHPSSRRSSFYETKPTPSSKLISELKRSRFIHTGSPNRDDDTMHSSECSSDSSRSSISEHEVRPTYSDSTIMTRRSPRASVRLSRMYLGKQILENREIQFSPKNLKTEKPSVISYRRNSVTSTTKTFWKASLIDIIIFVPRSSCSIDLVAFKLQSSTVIYQRVPQSWTSPDKLYECSSDHCLFYNTNTNSWTCDSKLVPNSHVNVFDQTVENSAPEDRARTIAPSTSRSFELDFHDRHEKKFVLEAVDDNYTYDNSLPLNRYNFQTIGAEIFVSLGDRLTNFEGSKNEEYLAGMDIFPAEVVNHDFVYLRRRRKTDKITSYKKSIWRKVSDDSFNLSLIIDRNEDQMRILVGDTVEPTPLSLNLSMAELYLIENIWFDNCAEQQQFFLKTTVSSPSSQLASASPGRNVEEIKYLPKYGSPDYFEFLRTRPSTWSIELVRSEISIKCFIDCDYFVREPSSLSALRDMSMNLSDIEKNYFGSINDYGQGNLEKRTREDLENRDSRHDSSNNDSHGLNMGKKTGGKVLNSGNVKWENVAMPALELHLVGAVLYVKGDDEGSNVGFTSGLVEIWDIRKPAVCAYPYNLALKVGETKSKRRSFYTHTSSHSARHTQRGHHHHHHHHHHHLHSHNTNKQKYTRKYYPPDLDFGLDMDPSNPIVTTDLGETTTAPFRIACLFSSVSNWSTTHIGLEAPDLCVSNQVLLDIVLEYFGGFFWIPEVKILF